MLHTQVRTGDAIRISVILDLIADPRASERLVVRDIVNLLGERGFAILLVLLGLPNIIPMVPPIPLICGMLVAMVSVQMMIGRRTPWLPQRLLAREMSRADVRRVVSRLRPWVERIERICRARLSFLGTELSIRLLGAVLFLLALGLLVAAPIVGQIPLGIAICLIGLGIVERDGVIVIAGAVVGAIGVSLSLGFAYAILSGARALLRSIGI